MKEAGYDIEFAAGLTAAGACIGPVFPPSIIFVIYGVMAEVSIGKLFIGGMVPGVLMALSLMVWVYITARRRGYPKDAHPNLKEFFLSFKEAFLALLTPVIIIGGILSGIFTATEAAIVTALWALFLGFFVYRELTLSNFIRILKQVAVQSAAVMFITSTAMIIGWILMRYRMPQILTTYLEQFSKNPYMILILVNIFFLILGCFMEVIASLVILTPILVPALSRMGIDPLHFGVVMTLNLMIGLLTPPFGMGLYTVQKVAGISFEQMVRGAAPFILPLLVVLGMITFWPQLVLFLPNLVIGK
jgi:tripartite ATP-independent transporter DctM subunit